MIFNVGLIVLIDDNRYDEEYLHRRDQGNKGQHRINRRSVNHGNNSYLIKRAMVMNVSHSII